jgi:tetratricopeptide (TPR) repeat protein
MNSLRLKINLVCGFVGLPIFLFVFFSLVYAQGHLQKARALYEEGKLEEAEKEFQKALEVTKNRVVKENIQEELEKVRKASSLRGERTDEIKEQPEEKWIEKARKRRIKKEQRKLKKERRKMRRERRKIRRRWKRFLKEETVPVTEDQ